jgi:hypothetical protein
VIFVAFHSEFNFAGKKLGNGIESLCYSQFVNELRISPRPFVNNFPLNFEYKKAKKYFLLFHSLNPILRIIGPGHPEDPIGLYQFNNSPNFNLILPDINKLINNLSSFQLEIMPFICFFQNLVTVLGFYAVFLDFYLL